MEKLYAIDEKVLLATLNYLAERPYKDVAMLIDALRVARQVEFDGKGEEASGVSVESGSE